MKKYGNDTYYILVVISICTLSIAVVTRLIFVL